MTTLVLGLGGAAIGFALGGPFGAAIGWSVGAMAGSYLDPQKIQGPRLSDLKLQGSSYGAFEPICYGTIRLAGNVIWQTDLKEASHTSGGKGGGGPKVTNYTYSASFDCLICEATIEQILKVWADGRLIYDNSGGAGSLANIPMTFYDGNESQAVCPLEEADTGVGLTPAYRGVARAVFENWELGDFGNRIPNLEFLVNAKGRTSGNIRLVKDIRQTGLESGVGGWAQSTTIGAWTTDLGDDTPLDLPSVTVAGGAPPQVSLSDGDRDYHYVPIAAIVLSTGEMVRTWVESGLVVDNNPNRNCAITFLEPTVQGPPLPHQRYINCANFALLVTDFPTGIKIQAVSFTQDYRHMFIFRYCESEANGSVDHWYRITSDENGQLYVADDGTVDPLVSGTSGIGYGAFTYTYTHAVSVVEPNLRYMWAYYGAINLGGAPDYGSLMLYHIDDAGNLSRIVNYGHPIPVERAAPAIWCFGEGYVGTIGTSHSFSPPGTPIDWSQTALWTRFNAESDAVTLAEIVADQCDRAGMDASTYDVTELVDIVDGYMMSNQMAGRSAIEALMAPFFFDAVESDGVLKFVKRGKSPVATIPDDDLAAHEDGQGLPALLSFTRKQEVDLPAEISINYFDKSRDYQIGTQTARRMVTSSELTSTVNVPVVFDANHAKQIVDAWLFNSWAERDEYTWYTTRKYVYLEPTDVVTVQGINLRITSKTESTTGVIKWVGLPNHVGVFAQAGQGSSGGGITPPGVTNSQQTQLMLFDLPLLGADTTQPSYRPAMAGGESASWKGAALFRSIDSGTTFSEVLTTSNQDVIGETTTALAVFGGGNVFDELNSVTVYLRNGATLESTTTDKILADPQHSLYVVGRELIQARDATLIATNTYTLTGLLRGRYGTEWAMTSHTSGEDFAAMPTVNEVPVAAGDYGIERTYKAVTVGSAATSGVSEKFIARGINVTPLSPVHPATGIDGDGNWIMRWNRRARVNGGWADGEIPLDEPTERYQLSIWSDAGCSVELARIETTAPTFRLKVKQQITIYGSQQTNPPAWTAAQMGVLGPGYDTLGRAPIVAVSTPPPPNQVPLGDVQWHADYRYAGGTNCELNFNWLQVNYSSSWAWAYMVCSNGSLRNSAAFHSDLGADATRIINTMAGAGFYAPAGFMVPYAPRVLPGPILSALIPLVQISLPYPDDDL